MAKKLKKVRIAFLGCGGMMGAHAMRLKNHPEVEICALGDISQSQLDKFVQRHFTQDWSRPVPPMFCSEDHNRMYRDTKPDAVLISTPHTCHYEQGIQALKYGCHVFMEKPMVTNLEHAYKLAEAVRKSRKVFVIGYNTPCSGEFAYLRECIRTGELGRLELVNGYLSQGWMKGTVGLWRQDPAKSGGGQAYDSGAHLLNSLCWSVASNVEEVFAFVDNHGCKVDINSVFSIRFANGVLASIMVSGNCPSDGAHMVFVFDNGRVEIDGWGGGWIKVWKGREFIKYPPITANMSWPSPDHNFIAAVLGKAKPRTSPLNGIIQSQLMDAIYESARTGRPARPKHK
ncbi:MAG: Gfo/Idh/MocA family protein [Phycisphaerae bacterium]